MSAGAESVSLSGICYGCSFQCLELLRVEIRLTMFTLTEFASKALSHTIVKEYKMHSDKMIYGARGKLTLHGISDVIMHSHYSQIGGILE